MIESEAIAAKRRQGTVERALTAAGRMRVSEKLVLVYLTYTAAAATFFRMSVTQGLTIAALNVATSAVIALLSRFSAERQVRRAQVWPAGTGRRWALTFTPNGGRSEFLAVVRDWFPAVVILLAYREAGVFVTPDPAHHLDFLFVAWDHALLGNAWVAGALQLLSPWIERYLEFCYAFCYPIVPLGLGALYALGEWPGLDRDAARGAKAGSPGEGRAVDYFWTTVLMALFTCYVLFPLFPSMPPRLLFHDSPAPAVQPVFRHVNFWILGRYGIDSSVFPSGHVAAVTSTALAVRAVWPRAGTAFAIAAVSVAAATVVGRYHYAADSLTGALIGVAAYLASSRIHTR